MHPEPSKPLTIVRVSEGIKGKGKFYINFPYPSKELFPNSWIPIINFHEYAYSRSSHIDRVKRHGKAWKDLHSLGYGVYLEQDGLSYEEFVNFVRRYTPTVSM